MAGDNDNDNDNGNSNGKYIIPSVLTGMFLISCAIGILWCKADITPELFFALRLVLALGAGFISAGILGTINIKIEPKANIKKMGNDTLEDFTNYYLTTGYQITLTAGGPIAITVLVWMYSPEVLGLVESVFIY